MVATPLGNIAIAVHPFVITAESLCHMPGHGTSEIAATLVGQSTGADRYDLHRSSVWITVSLSMVVMAFVDVIMYVFAPEMIGLLSPVINIQVLGTSVLRVEASAEPFLTAAITAYNVCTGAGDALKPSLINLGSMWPIRLTLAYTLATQHGLRGV